MEENNSQEKRTKEEFEYISKEIFFEKIEIRNKRAKVISSFLSEPIGTILGGLFGFYLGQEAVAFSNIIEPKQLLENLVVSHPYITTGVTTAVSSASLAFIGNRFTYLASASGYFLKDFRKGVLDIYNFIKKANKN